MVKIYSRLKLSLGKTLKKAFYQFDVVKTLNETGVLFVEHFFLGLLDFVSSVDDDSIAVLNFLLFVLLDFLGCKKKNTFLC
jgi:hypothetical protein